MQIFESDKQAFVSIDMRLADAAELILDHGKKSGQKSQHDYPMILDTSS